MAHYLKTYGTRTEKILANCINKDSLGEGFTSILYQAEVDYLVKEEWAMSSEDILWRRTKLGLTIDKTSEKALERYLSISRK